MPRTRTPAPSPSDLPTEREAAISAAARGQAFTDLKDRFARFLDTATPEEVWFLREVLEVRNCCFNELTDDDKLEIACAFDNVLHDGNHHAGWKYFAFLCDEQDVTEAAALEKAVCRFIANWRFRRGTNFERVPTLPDGWLLWKNPAGARSDEERERGHDPRPAC